MRKVIIALDPGLTTGVAIVDRIDGQLLEWYTPTSPQEVSQLITDCGRNPNYETIGVYEDFIGGGPRTTEAIFVLKLCGRIELAFESADVEYTARVPQHRLPCIHDARGRVEKGTSKHVIDAYAHALAALEKANHGRVVR